METIKQFRASDGQIFDNKKDCAAHEHGLQARQALINAMPGDWDSGREDGDTSMAAEIADWIIDHFNEISEILKPPRKPRTAQK